MTSTSINPAPVRGAGSDDIPFNPKLRQRRSVSDWVVDIVIWLLIALVVVAIVYPIWFIVIASVSDQTMVSQGKVFLLPAKMNFGGYAKVFTDSRIWVGYRNTIFYSVAGTALNMLVTIPAAFALSRREFKPRRVILFLMTRSRCSSRAA